MQAGASGLDQAVQDDGVLDDEVAALVAAARREGEALLVGDLADRQRSRGHRGLMAMVKSAVVLLVHPAARVEQGDRLAREALGWLTDLEGLRDREGLFSSGDNLASPPDTAFTITDAAITVEVLRRAGSGALDDVRERLEGVLRAAAPALATGGVHTPNHRWELAAAMARSGAVLTDDGLLERARTWLSEGVDVDEDGLYSERSANYAARVSNPSLTSLGDVLGREDLHEVVHRNLHAHLDLTDPQGRVETVHSRRQDQWASFPLGPFLGQLRRAAITRGCALCAAGARRAATSEGVDAVGILADQLIDPTLAGPLPPAAGDAPRPRRRLFRDARLLRDLRGGAVPLEATVYAGSDVPAVGRIASGLACNPTFLRLWLGRVGVSSARISRDFFGLGPFRACELDVEGDHVTLRESLSAAYYQPLPPSARRSDGRYDLEREGRFAAAMSFSERDRDVLTLTTTVEIDLHDDGVDLAITTDGPVAGHSLELALVPGGSLTGAVPLGDDAHQLVEGVATHRTDGDVLHIGPGTGAGADRPAVYRPGEAYTFLGGTDAVGGTRLYLTWTSPGTVRYTLSRLPLTGVQGAVRMS